jgi:TolA-binding protein
MRLITAHRRRWAFARRGRLAGAGLVLASMFLVGCSTLSPGDTVVLSRDMLAIKNDVATIKESQGALDRKLDYSINTMSDGMQNRNSAMTASVDDIAKRLADQSTQMDNLRTRVEELNFALDRLSKQLAMTTGVGEMTGDTSGTPPAGRPLDQAFAKGLSLFNGGQYGEARGAFQQALDLKPADAGKTQEIQFWLGRACLELNDLPAAENNLTQAILANAESPIAWEGLEYLADLKVRQGDAQRASEWYKQIVDRNPNYSAIERVRSKLARLASGAGMPTAPTPTATPQI